MDGGTVINLQSNYGYYFLRKKVVSEKVVSLQHGDLYNEIMEAMTLSRQLLVTAVPSPFTKEIISAKTSTGSPGGLGISPPR